MYYELNDYIFAHGGIDVELDDWKSDTKRNFMWNKQHLMKSMPGKTIVVGHTQAVRVLTDEKNLKELYSEKPELFDILYGDGTIHIDGSVVDTQKVNVLILDL